MALPELQTQAYRAVLRAVAATQLDWSKEKLLTDLRKELAITTQEHFEVLSAVMQDKEIEALRENRAPEPGGPPGNAALLDSGGPGKRKKDALGQGGIRMDKKLLKKPRHLELQESPLESPGLPMHSPMDPPPAHRGPGRPVARPGAGLHPQQPSQFPGSYATPPGSAFDSSKRGPGRPPGRHLEAQGLGEGKRGPGRPPQRLSSQASFGSARSGGAVGSGRRGRGSGVGRHSAIALELAPETNELIGRRIWRYWPMEENPWPEGIISDYREETDEHCIVYNINTPQESYEWFRIRDAKTPEEYRLAEGYADDFRELVSGHRAKLASAAGAGHAQPSRQRHAGGRLHSKRGGKSGGRGRPLSARTSSLAAAPLPNGGAAGVALPGPAESVALGVGCPYSLRALAEKLSSAGAAELHAMVQALNLRAAEIALEMQTLEELDRDDLDTQQRLTLHITDLGAREKAIHAQLAALNEEAGSDLL